MKSYLRFLSRNKLYTIIEILGLSISIAFVILLSSYIIDEMSCNKMLKDTDDIYLCHETASVGCFPEVMPLFDKIHEIEASCSFMPTGVEASLFEDITTVSAGEHEIAVNALPVSENFFEFFSFPMKSSDREIPVISKNSVVISETLADELFPDSDPIGKTILLSEGEPMTNIYGETWSLDTHLTIAGVFKPFAKTIFIEPDIFINLDLFLQKQEELYKGAAMRMQSVFVRLHEDADKDSVAERLNKEFEKTDKRSYGQGWNLSVGLTPFKDINKQDYRSITYVFDNIRDMKLFGTYLAMCIFLVLVSLIDYMVLTVAFSRFRIKEIATRQILGTEKADIRRRCFGEALLLMIISLVIAIILALTSKGYVGQIIGVRLSPFTHIHEVYVLVGLVILMAAAASAFPSFVLTSCNAIDVVKGEARYRDKVSFGKIFIGITGMVSIGALSICFGISGQTRHLIQQPIGYETEGLVKINFIGDKTFRHYDELKQLPFIEKLGSFSSDPTSYTRTSIIHDSGRYDDYFFIHGNRAYFDILGIEFLEKFNSSADFHEIYMCRSSYESSKEYRDGNILRKYTPVAVSGTVSDFKIGSLKEDTSGRFCGIEVFDHPMMIEYGNILAKVSIDAEAAARQIEDFYRSKDFDESIVSVRSMKRILEEQVKEETSMMKLLTGFALLCLLMTTLTIIGLSSYHSKTNEKCVAVRNVFGCSKRELLRKTVLGFSLPVLAGAAVAVPVAWCIIDRWLEGYAVRTENSAMIYISASAITLGVVLISIMVQAVRLMHTNPAEVLKKE